MKLRKVILFLVPALAISMLFGACSKTEKEETKSTTVATKAAATEEDEDESEDIDDYDDDDFTFDYSDMIPAQDMEIDENYLKFYDYDQFFSTDEYYEPQIAKADDFTDETIKELFQKYSEEGYEIYSAEEYAKNLVGMGYIDEETGWGICYLYNGFSAYRESDDGEYSYAEVYKCTPEILADIGYVVKDEDDKTITFVDNPNKLCPSDTEVIYDKETQTACISYSYKCDMTAAVG